MTPEQETHIASMSRWIAVAITVAGVLGAGAMLIVYFKVVQNGIKIEHAERAIRQIDQGEPPSEWQSWVEQQLQELHRAETPVGQVRPMVPDG